MSYERLLFVNESPAFHLFFKTFYRKVFDRWYDMRDAKFIKLCKIS